MAEKVLRGGNSCYYALSLFLALVLTSCLQGKQQSAEESGTGKEAPVRNELHELRKRFGNRTILGVFTNADSLLQSCLGRLATLSALLDLCPTVNSLTDRETDEMLACLKKS